MTIAHIIPTLTPAAAQTLAEYFRELANSLDGAAETKAQTLRQSAAVRAKLKALTAAANAAAKLAADKQITLTDAAHEIAAARALDAGTVYRMARRHGGSARAQRDRLVRQLARDGRTNAEIGARVNLHPCTVSRILNVK